MHPRNPTEPVSAPAPGALVRRHRVSTRLWRRINAISVLVLGGLTYGLRSVNYEWYAGIRPFRLRS